jgi:hypothetical protein
MSQSTQYYQLTITPGFYEFEEPIKNYVERTNYGPSMTVYTINNQISALFAKKRLESEGYIVHLEKPDGSTTATQYQQIYNGIKL